MSQYYFLVASLPLLSFEDREAADPAAFLDTLRDHLGPTELDVLAGARIDAPLGQESWSEEAAAPDILGSAYARPVHPLVASWEAFERGLRNALVRLRAVARGADAGQYIRLDAAGHEDSDSVEIAEAAREAFTHDSPLSGEEILNRARWTFLDELEVGHFFDLHRVITYYLKLQIIARRALFTRKNGEEAFVRVNETIMNDYYQEQSE